VIVENEAGQDFVVSRQSHVKDPIKIESLTLAMTLLMTRGYGVMLDREDFVTLIKEETERVGSGVQESGFLDQVITKAREQRELCFFGKVDLEQSLLKILI
jgi:hypothetical protein